MTKVENKNVFSERLKESLLVAGSLILSGTVIMYCRPIHPASPHNAVRRQCWQLYNKDNNKSNLRRKHLAVRPPSCPSDVYVKLLTTCSSFCKSSYTDIRTPWPALFDYCNAAYEGIQQLVFAPATDLVYWSSWRRWRTKGQGEGPRGRDNGHGDIDWCQQYNGPVTALTVATSIAYSCRLHMPG